MTVHTYEAITWWQVTGSNGYGGFTFAAPVVIEGRWEDKQVRFMSHEGEELTSVALAYIDTDVSSGDFLARGDESGNALPEDATEAHRIEKYDKVPDLRLVEVVRKVMM